MCKRCGDVKLIACLRCKGVGSVKPGVQIGFKFLGDIYESLGSGGGTESGMRSIPCADNQTRGHFRCPDCSKASV
ncbi:hypothetical protein Ancab_034880 [Ancistrocladus abbreviatus]